MSTRPTLVSHTGVKATCDTERNLSDKAIKAIATKEGIIGIGFFKGATCGTTIDDIIKAIVYTKNLVGIDHVVLGSDFDGKVATPLDATSLYYISDALLEYGFTMQEVKYVMGENIKKFLLKNLPEL